MKFNAKDLDPQKLKDRAQKEALQIFEKPSTRKGRSLQEITEACLFGHASELYLIEHHGFIDDERKYKDLFDPTNKPVEIKAVGYLEAVQFEIDRCNQRRLEPWREFPDIVYMFIGDRKTYDYYLHDIYIWNESKKIFTSQKN